MSTPSITCPDCGRTSWNPNDVREGYCGACHAYTARCDEPGCSERGLVRVNARRVCLAHVDEAMAAATGPLRDFLTDFERRDR